MAGTTEGGKLAAQRNKEKYGPDFYAKIGAKGGKSSGTGGFASDKKDTMGMTGRQRAAYWGRIGGTISKRTK